VITDPPMAHSNPSPLHRVAHSNPHLSTEGSHVAVFPELLVSKRHATVSFCTGKYYVLDEGTMNGTYLNKERLSIQKEVSER